jgi:hypothetical protein
METGIGIGDERCVPGELHWPDLLINIRALCIIAARRTAGSRALRSLPKRAIPQTFPREHPSTPIRPSVIIYTR